MTIFSRVGEGKNGIIIVLCLAMTFRPRAVNMAHQDSGFTEKALTGDRAEQAASLTRELEKLMIELEEHRGKHYYTGHAELVKSALEGLREADAHNQKSAGEIHKSYLRSHIQSAMQAMPNA